MKKQLVLTFLLILFVSITYAQEKNLDKFDFGDDDMPLLMPSPVFKDGGDKGLAKFLANNLKYPDGEHIPANVFIEFIIDTLGNVKNEKVINGMTRATDAEALRVVGLLKFIPVKVMDKPIAIKHHLFIDFSIIDKKEKQQ